MERDITPNRRRPRRLLWCGSLLARAWWFVPLLILALYVRWPGLNKPFHHDEWQTLIPYETSIAAKSIFSTAWASKLAWNGIYNASLPWARAPFLAIGLLTVLVGWGFGRVWKDWFAGFLIALALAL